MRKMTRDTTLTTIPETPQRDTRTPTLTRGPGTNDENCMEAILSEVRNALAECETFNQKPPHPSDSHCFNAGSIRSIKDLSVSSGSTYTTNEDLFHSPAVTILRPFSKLPRVSLQEIEPLVIVKNSLSTRDLQLAPVRPS